MTGPQELIAKRERVSSFVGAGCLIQAAGFLAPLVLYWVFGFIAGASGQMFGLVIGLILLAVMFIYGSRKASLWRCGNCKNPIASKDVNMCPVCRATLR